MWDRRGPGEDLGRYPPFSSIVIKEPKKTLSIFRNDFIAEPSCDVAKHMLEIAEQESAAGRSANARRDFKTAFLHYRTIAYSNSSPIQALLGLSTLYQGNKDSPIKQDLVSVKYWLLQAIRCGSYIALEQLVELHRTHQDIFNVERNPEFLSLHTLCLAVTSDSSNMVKRMNLLQWLRANVPPFRARLLLAADLF